MSSWSIIAVALAFFLPIIFFASVFVFGSGYCQNSQIRKRVEFSLRVIGGVIVLALLVVGFTFWGMSENY